jgi:hypothetical protein
MSLKASLKGQCVEKKLTLIEGVEYAAIFRYPLGRWISGFATHLAAKIHNNIIAFDEVMRLLHDEQCLEHIFNTLAFDTHTKPQHLFITGLDNILPFDAKNRDPFYQWLNDKGIEASDAKLHHVENFDKNEPHYIIFKKLENIVYNDANKVRKINQFYRKDLEIYERITNH